MEVIILVPSSSPTGPMKGAVALANALSLTHPTCIVSLKDGRGFESKIRDEVRQLSLASCRFGIVGKLWELKRQISRSRRNTGVTDCICISICFSADLINAFLSRHAVTISSVRGNLLANYLDDYGILGYLVAKAHFLVLKRIHFLTVLTESLCTQIGFQAHRKPTVIRNFIDERVVKYRADVSNQSRSEIRFIFVGTLSKRKGVMKLLEAVHLLTRAELNIKLDLVGSGPLDEKVDRLISALSLNNVITRHRHVQEPFALISQADCMVIPSSSEGTSRAMLEALFIGIPCIAKKVDGNAELINASNGFLFDSYESLALVMLSAYRQIRINRNQHKNHAISCLLPKTYREEVNVAKWNRLLQKIEEFPYLTRLTSRSVLSILYKRLTLYPMIRSFCKGHILDIGCGLGDFVEYCRNCSGIEICSALVEYGNLRNLNISQFDGVNIPRKDDSVYNVLLDNVLEHIENPMNLLLEIKRILKKNTGMVVILVPGKKGYYQDYDHKVFYDKTNLSALMESLGFHCQKNKYIPMKSEFLSNILPQYLYVSIWIPDARGIGRNAAQHNA